MLINERAVFPASEPDASVTASETISDENKRASDDVSINDPIVDNVDKLLIN